MSENIEKKEIQLDKNELKKQALLIGKAMLFSFLILFIIALFGETSAYNGASQWSYNEPYYEVGYEGVLGDTHFDNKWFSYNGSVNFFQKIYIVYIPLILKVNFMTFFILSLIIYLIIRKTKNYTIKIKDSENSNLLQKNSEKQQQNDFLLKLEKAYREGLLTEEEYHRKISENNKIQEVYSKEEHIEKSIEEKIDEEKEKFRKLHSDGVITYDEMQEKFKQIEKYHQSKNED